MRKDIRFAGLTLSWTSQYAQSYKEKLFEMGYTAKVIEFGGSTIVAYAIRAFTRHELTEALEKLLDDEGNHDNPSE